uniref:RNA-directed RNA polymerase n=1 Tax=Papaya virus Q TaxID=2804712 RepID=A0A7U0IZ15_9TOMB|nr:RNA-dependent RNA polymerase [Papaya virus Q]
MSNLLRGFCTRVWRYKGADPIPCRSGRIPTFERNFKAFQVSPWTRQMVVDNALPRRRTLFQRAADSLECCTLSSRDSTVFTFIKAEKFNYCAKPDADPRLIQPRSERFLVEHGTFVKAVEKPVYSCLARLNGGLPMVAKGFNARETACILREMWTRFRNPVCVSLDASRFDQHVSVEMLKFTHRIYRRFFSSSAERRRLSLICQWTLENAGKARCREGSFKYQVRGRRMSGDMDTALGNCLIMCALTYEFLSCCGIDFYIFNNGDDCLFICEDVCVPSVSKVCSWYQHYGFRVVEEERVGVFERISFCQTSPVLTSGGWVMCRSPRVLAKDLTYIGPKSALGLWLDAIGQCGLALCDGVPIFHVFYSMLLHMGKKKNNIRNSMLYSCGLTRLADRLEFRGLAVDDACRLSFARAFGILPDDQIAIERDLVICGTFSEGNPMDNVRYNTLISCVTLMDHCLSHPVYPGPRTFVPID